MKKDWIFALCHTATCLAKPLATGLLALLLLLWIPLAVEAQTPPGCAPPPAGLVSWWPGEDTAADVVWTNNGVLKGGATCAAGKVGQGFNLNGNSQSVQIPYSRNLITSTYSFEGWVKPLGQVSDPINQDLIFGQSYGACQMVARTGSSGVRIAFQFGTDHYTFYSVVSTVDLPIGQFSHLAGTWDGTTLRLYINGSLNAQSTPGASPVDSGCAFSLGGFDACGYVGQFFNGVIDEASYYSRALSGAEIQSVYNADSAGKCRTPVPPLIRTPPQSQSVAASSNASFSVVAAGTPPLSYQWHFNGVSIGGATGSVLTLADVQAPDAGTYDVTVTNLYGTTNSIGATLTVLAKDACTKSPEGLVSWWKGDGNANDFAGTNNGTLLGGATFAAGKVGQGFSMSGTSQGVLIPHSPNLICSNFSVETWVKPATQVSDSTYQDLIFGQSYGACQMVARRGSSGVRIAFVIGTSSVSFYDVLSTNEIPIGQFSHLVGTWNGTTLRLYVNGVSHAQRTLAVQPVDSGCAFFLGGFAPGPNGCGYVGQFFSGIIDETSYYSRALNGAEIAALYNAGTSGKCQEAPAILIQPASQLVNESSNVTFTVTASGTPQLHYQWRFNGSHLAGATGTSLLLTNVQANQAGSYSVRVTNAFGSVVSSNAVLAVNRFPVARCADVAVSATSGCVANASINNGSYDPDGDLIGISQSPPGPYPPGTNLVTLTVTDDKGAFSSCSAFVIVRDGTAPVVACPASQVLEFQNETGATATYNVTATDLCSAVTLVVTPPSGSRLPIGLTPVTAQATDGYGNTAQCNFSVTVLGAQGVKSNVLTELTALRASTPMSEDFAQKFDNAIQHLSDSLNPEYWIDQTHLQASGGNTAMNEEKLSVVKLQEILQSGPCPVFPPLLQSFIDRIVKCDRLLAVISVQEAAQAGLNPRKVAQDMDLVAKGDSEAEKGHYANAIAHYRSAWRHALQLSLRICLNPDSSTRVRFIGNNSKSYRIEVSRDMVNWTSLGTCKADAEGNVEFTDPNAGDQSPRFYRAVEQ